MITVEQAKVHGAESSTITKIEVSNDEIKFLFNSEKPFIEGDAYLKISGKFSDFEEFFHKVKQAASLFFKEPKIEDTF